MRRRLSFIWAIAALAAATMIFAPMAHVVRAETHGVVISAMYPGGGNTGATYTHDYIEIFNASDVPVDITGWTVQYSNPVSAHWQKTFLPEIMLLPGQYLLARQDDGPNGTVAPPADAQGSVGMQGDGSFKVTIVRSRLTIHGHSPMEDPSMQGKIEDFFGGGAANRWEGQAANPGTPLTWTQAWFRHDGGCQDTDNNHNDFYVATAYPNARSLQSPLSPCSGIGTTGTINSTGTISAGQQVSVTVTDADLPGSSVAISAAASNGDAEALTLNGSGGVFTGTFTVANAPGSAGNGSLEVQSGTITFTYVDALDGGGLTNQNRTDVTTVDAVGAIGTTGVISAPSSILSGGDYTVTVTDADLLDLTIHITITSDAGEQQVLPLGRVSAGVYSATFTTTDAAPTPNNGLIEGLAGDVLTARYNDQHDSSGSVNQSRTADTTINAPVVATDIELVVNGGLENGSTGWTFMAGAKRKCSANDCTFKLRPSAKAHQRGVMGPILAATETAAGDVVQISADVRTKKASKQRVVMLVVKYVDPAAGAAGNGKDKFKLFVEQATSGYETFSADFVLDGEINGGRVVVANTLSGGNLRVDDVSVILRPTGVRTPVDSAAVRSADGLLPVPAAPDAFRGGN